MICGRYGDLDPFINMLITPHFLVLVIYFSGLEILVIMSREFLSILCANQENIFILREI